MKNKISKYEVNFIAPKLQIEIRFWKIANDLKYNVLKSNNESMKIWGFYNYKNNIIRIREESLEFENSKISGITNSVVGTMSIKNSISELLNMSDSLDKELDFHFETTIDRTEKWISNSSKLNFPFTFHISIYFDFKCQMAYYTFSFPNVIGEFYILFNSSNNFINIYSSSPDLSNENLTLDEINKYCNFSKLFNYFISNFDDSEQINSNNNSFNFPWFFSTIFFFLLSKQINIDIYENEKLINKNKNSKNLEERYPFTFKCEFIKNMNNCEISENILKFDLKIHLDPYLLQKKMNNINIDLIKWRLVPSLEQDRFKNLKFLIIGSGTLGCNVARCLIGWGIRNFIFIDNSEVNLNNPSRQSLFTFEDAKLKKNKALAAVERLKYICPDILAEGVPFNIPLLGDTTIKIEEFINSYEKLKNYILESDVLMLLTDTKESRWIPTVLTALINRYYNKKKPKLCVTVGLGFDSFIVTRNTFIEENLCSSGCYFCGDLSINSKLSHFDIPIDQQCSVVRIGVSYFASCIAVELIINLTQHPLFLNAPHSNNESSLLGYTPQCIRGFLNNFSICNEPIQRNENCIACSNHFIDKLFNDEIDTITRIFYDPKEVENICGLRRRKQEIESLLLNEDYQPQNF